MWMRQSGWYCLWMLTSSEYLLQLSKARWKERGWKPHIQQWWALLKTEAGVKYMGWYLLCCPCSFWTQWKMHAGLGKLQRAGTKFLPKKTYLYVCHCVVWVTKTSCNPNTENLSQDEPAAVFQRAWLKWKQGWYSVPQGCCFTSLAVCAVLCKLPGWICSPVLYPSTTVFPFPIGLTKSQCCQGLIVILSSLSLFPLSSPCCHAIHQPPPDNDVLIMRLLGQQIALQSHSHAVENCCCLGDPPLCVSGRLTLASCWDWCSGTGAGALSPSLWVRCRRMQRLSNAITHASRGTVNWCQTIRHCVADSRAYIYCE